MTLLVAVFLVEVGGVGAAGAHATFTGPATVEAGRDVTLVMDVPHERDEGTFNVEVLVAVPIGWQPTSCVSKPTWTCAVTTVDGRSAVRFVKDTGAPAAEDERFGFAARAGSANGPAAFPTLQTYSSGEVVRWTGAATTAFPAPVLQVTAGSGAPPASLPPATLPPATLPQSPTLAAPSPVPGVPTSGPATSIMTTLVPDTAARSTTTAAPATTPTSSPVVGVLATGQPQEPAPGAGQGRGLGIRALVLIAVAGIVTAAAAAVAFSLRRRSGPAA